MHKILRVYACEVRYRTNARKSPHTHMVHFSLIITNQSHTRTLLWYKIIRLMKIILKKTYILHTYLHECALVLCLLSLAHINIFLSLLQIPANNLVHLIWMQLNLDLKHYWEILIIFSIFKQFWLKCTLKLLLRTRCIQAHFDKS